MLDCFVLLRSFSKIVVTNLLLAFFNTFLLLLTQMMFTFEHASYHEMKRLVFISTKITVGLLILICFGTSLVTSNEGIPFCKEQLQRLKQDVEVWNERCWNNTDHGNSTPCCEAEKEYNQERMKMHVEMCFYSG